MNNLVAQNVIKSYPKERPALPEDYQRIYDQHFQENRNGTTNVSRLSSRLEGWMHKKVAETAAPGLSTLEIGAGSLNQFKYEEKEGYYDIIEPYHQIYEHSPFLNRVDHFYDDISEVPETNRYGRIISVATFEHILNLPIVIERAIKLLNPNGLLAIAIPNEGRFLWKYAYRNTTGREFHKRYGLDYEVIMRHEHVNTADEIECLLRYYFL